MRRQCWLPGRLLSERWDEGLGYPGAQRPGYLALPGAEDSKSGLEEGFEGPDSGMGCLGP